MAVLSSRAHEQQSREKNVSRFLCPRPPLLLSAPNQNRHATQAENPHVSVQAQKREIDTQKWVTVKQ